jgi:hypothetical protein
MLGRAEEAAARFTRRLERHARLVVLAWSVVFLVATVAKARSTNFFYDEI